MYDYYTEIILEIPIKIFKQKLSKKELEEMDAAINHRASEGWELVTYTFMGGDDKFGQTVLATFRKNSTVQN